MSEKQKSRRDRDKKVNYNYEKFGSIGVFSTESSLPIEYFLTSIPISEIEDLSLARDVQTAGNNFEYLIQRDIDEERARKDICSYIAASEEGKAVFLPPLIVSIVQVNNDNYIEGFYPEYNSTIDGRPIDPDTKYDDGSELVREWKGLFKLSSLVESDGVKISSENEVSNIPQDIQQVNFEAKISKSTSGGRLVVIDGQHRLFALQYLAKHDIDKVKNITVPVCILYSPKSTERNFKLDNNIQNITSVLRRLFVDVNSTVEKVSGHFLTLLSDDNLGSMICREFCSKVHSTDVAKGRSLGLVEWNTKNHKESKTKARTHTITSIGVIYDTLEKTFDSKKGIKLLRDFLNVHTSNITTDSLSDENLPWSGFNTSYKNELKEVAKNEIVGNLYTLFFEPEVYKKSVEIFEELLDVKLVEAKDKRDALSDCVTYINKYYLFNDPLPDIDGDKINSNCKNMLKTYNNWFEEQIIRKSNPIAYLSIYQKSVITGWIELCVLMNNKGLNKSDMAEIYVLLMNYSLNPDLNLFDYSQRYIQDNIYSGVRIKATATSASQFKNATLAFLGNSDVLDIIQDKFNLSNEIVLSLSTIGKDSASVFFKKMVSEKEKSFSKNYRHNYSLSPEQKRSLADAENLRNSEIYSTEDSSVKVEAAVKFDELVKHMIKDDLKDCAEKLSIKFGYNDFFYLVQDSDFDLDDEV
ncbi:TPA: hypothetical protein NKB37_002874 [Vibrio parahaemolyticus]|uniref:hypothetical protein n=1 Tax=Vibrio parahaemolyticus TaxID=670 RepID=UPI00040F376C|nr:hypothetical protein [Vibrio parahaemolyticus]ALG52498.1 hypothetical protein FORC6_2172 [Vibrio parahaemolyticus]EJG0887045.1 hypothetical protein [Vibrio parahaemolyticus]MBE4060744.1 hypothetical protein [Vibrio parahaemolyticus]MBE4240260.1 hypothetical protein [Vibrio parahaemolyticus]MDG3052110.1 hypothetical protein [Vibrio parahaemolyticus]